MSYLYRDPIPLNRFRHRWWSTPQFYAIAAILTVLALAAAIYLFYLVGELRQHAQAYDLSKLEQMESASVILDRNEKIFGQIYVENRETIPYEQLPRDLINAVVSMEDTKFYSHSGYDLFGIVRAALKNVTSGAVRQGASTITQQLARNSFELKEKTFRRKLVEVFLAGRIEEQFGKQKIMELYLNRIYFGGGLYGAEAASRGYFGKPAREMTLAEAATVAGLIKSPNKLSPWTNKTASREARNLTLSRMHELGFISRDARDASMAEELVVGSKQSARGQTYAVAEIRQTIVNAVGWDRAIQEGLRVHTTLDMDLQKAAEESLRANLARAEEHPEYQHQKYADYAATFKKPKPGGSPPPRPEYLQGAVIAVDNATGGILALVGGRDFDHTEFDRALNAKRPAGTAMTPFVFAAAFAKGAYPGTVIEDSALDNRTVMIGGTTGILGEWGSESPENRYQGPITAREALVEGKNGATVRLGFVPGVDEVLQLAKNAGIKSQMRPFPATFLGASEITLAELAIAYTIFPNGGTRPATWHIVTRITDKEGNVVWEPALDRTRKKTIQPEIAYEVHSCLEEVLEKGTASEAKSKYSLQEIPGVAGKTGTAYDFTDALFVGYDSAITCAVWAGFDKPQKIYRGAFGRDLALPVWVEVMNASVPRYAAREIRKPPGLNDVEICRRSGLLATDKCPGAEPYRELATKAQMPADPCNVHGPRRTITRDLPESEFPRAALAVDTSNVIPVNVKGPTLLAEEDPYGSEKSTQRPKPVATPQPTPAPTPVRAIVTMEMPDPSKPILRAEPVQPGTDHFAPLIATPPPIEIRRALPRGTPVEVRRAEPVRRPLILPARPVPEPEEEEEG